MSYHELVRAINRLEHSIDALMSNDSDLGTFVRMELVFEKARLEEELDAMLSNIE